MYKLGKCISATTENTNIRDRREKKERQDKNHEEVGSGAGCELREEVVWGGQLLPASASADPAGRTQALAHPACTHDPAPQATVNWS